MKKLLFAAIVLTGCQEVKKEIPNGCYDSDKIVNITHEELKQGSTFIKITDNGDSLFGYSKEWVLKNWVNNGMSYICAIEKMDYKDLQQSAFDITQRDTIYIFYEKEDRIKMCWSADGKQWYMSTVIKGVD